MQPREPRAAVWKSLIIAAIALLVVAGMVVVLFNLPIVTGRATGEVSR